MDDAMVRDCECGHREHAGRCYGTRTTYYPMGAQVPEGAQVTIVRPNSTDLQRVDERCPCERFYEYEGPDEPTAWY